MSDSDLTFPDEPRVGLDRRLSDLVQVANEVLATQGRLRELLRANQAISAGLDLDTVLRRIVDAARSLTGAQYAALGVIGPHGDIEQFIQAGMDEATVQRIGRLPRGIGLLGALVTDPRPIRIPDITVDPRSAGLPDGHPPMRDFLGVPVPVRDVVYGNLYLSGAPRGAFDEEDEQLVRALASTAGIAVENARLYQETQRREEWAAASIEVTARLLDPAVGEALPLIAERILGLASAMSTYVLIIDEADRLTVSTVRGRDPARARGAAHPLAGTFAERAVRGGETQRYDEAEIRAFGCPRLDAFGPMMVLPLRTPDQALGALLVARAPRAPAFTEAELAVASDFAGRASVALELVRARRQTERMLLWEERGRIARDLHDRVIQQLFATGMQLQGVLGTLPPGRNADRIDAAILSQDDSIAQIRRIIFTLQSPVRTGAPASGRQQLFELVAQQSAALGVEPTVTVAGPIDAVLAGDLAEDVLAVVAEGISNAVKHAVASEISVEVSVDVAGVHVVVANDGLPLGDSGRRSGLGNLEERAVRRRGRMTLEATEGRTELTWVVPVEPADDPAPSASAGTKVPVAGAGVRPH